MKFDKMVAFTICANNYLAYALILCQSFKAHHPNTPFWVLLVDKKKSQIDYNQLCVDQILWVDDLDLDIESLAEKFNIAELCTVVKPEAIRKLFHQGFTQVIYLDPDIQVFSKFKEVFEELPKHDMIVTPHICSPIPKGIVPSDHTLMRTGVYNLGFVAFNKTKGTVEFLEWWSNRVQRFGFHDVKNGYFFDQIWIMWAPAFLETVNILRHLGYNAANWNLHERHFSLNSGNKYKINFEYDLRFFHFSHFRPDKFPQLASYNRSFNAENRPDVNDLFSDYIRLLEANNHSQFKKIPIAYGKVFIDDAEKSKRAEKERLEKAKGEAVNSRLFKVSYHLRKALKLLIKG